MITQRHSNGLRNLEYSGLIFPLPLSVRRSINTSLKSNFFTFIKMTEAHVVVQSIRFVDILEICSTAIISMTSDA